MRSAVAFKADQQLLGAIYSAQDSLDTYAPDHITLPKDLATAGLKNSKDVSYKVTSDTTYELCATFRSEAKAPAGTSDVPVGDFSAVNNRYDTSWPTYHAKGHQCKTFTAMLKPDPSKPYLVCEDFRYRSERAAGTIQALDAKKHTITVQYKQYNYQTPNLSANLNNSGSGTTVTQTFTLAPSAKLFDFQCTPIHVSDLHVGQTINIFQNDANASNIDAIEVTRSAQLPITSGGAGDTPFHQPKGSGNGVKIMPSSPSTLQSTKPTTSLQ
jgi:hypothetical protein